MTPFALFLLCMTLDRTAARLAHPLSAEPERRPTPPGALAGASDSLRTVVRFVAQNPTPPPQLQEPTTGARERRPEPVRSIALLGVGDLSAPIIAGFAGVGGRVITHPNKEEQMDQNSINLTGRLTRDSELRELKEERSVCVLRVAFSQRGASQETGYVDVEVWGAYGETCAKLTKGQRVAVSGRLAYREWEGEAGRRHEFHIVASDVIFLSPRTDAEEASSTGAQEVPAAA
jgi:single-strand DNA-binding protein